MIKKTKTVKSQHHVGRAGQEDGEDEQDGAGYLGGGVEGMHW